MAENDREAALQRAIEEFGEAWARGDSASMDALLSPTYTHIDIFGAFHDRASWLGYSSGRTGRATKILFRDVKTRFAGDLAIVTGINEVEGSGVRNAQDQTKLALRFTQVWRTAEGKWLREAFQATPIDSSSHVS